MAKNYSVKAYYKERWVYLAPFGNKDSAITYAKRHTEKTGEMTTVDYSDAITSPTMVAGPFTK